MNLLEISALIAITTLPVIVAYETGFSKGFDNGFNILKK